MKREEMEQVTGEKVEMAALYDRLYQARDSLGTAIHFCEQARQEIDRLRADIERLAPKTVELMRQERARHVGNAQMDAEFAKKMGIR